MEVDNLGYLVWPGKIMIKVHDQPGRFLWIKSTNFLSKRRRGEDKADRVVCACEARLQAIRGAMGPLHTNRQHPYPIRGTTVSRATTSDYPSGDKCKVVLSFARTRPEADLAWLGW